LSNNKVIIIGAGISGLSAGCYLQMNGYDTEIIEAHTLPGGLCTSWQRRGYTFDGCIHWLAGSGRASPFYEMWSELLHMPAIEFVDHDLRFDIELEGQVDRHGDPVFHVYADVERLGRYLMDIAPEDARTIREWITSIRELQRYSLPPLWDVAPEVRTLRDKLRLVRYLPCLLHLGLAGLLLLLELLYLLHQVPLLLPAGPQSVSLLFQFGNFRFQVLETGLGLLGPLHLHRLLLYLQAGDVALQVVDLGRHAFDFHLQAAGCLVHQVDRFIRQEPVRDVTVRKAGRRHQGRILDSDAVVDLVLLLQAAENRNGVLHRRFADHHRLEPALQRLVLFHVLAVLIQGGGPDAPKLASGQGRL